MGGQLGRVIRTENGGYVLESQRDVFQLQTIGGTNARTRSKVTAGWEETGSNRSLTRRSQEESGQSSSGPEREEVIRKTTGYHVQYE